MDGGFLPAAPSIGEARPRQARQERRDRGARGRGGVPDSAAGRRYQDLRELAATAPKSPYVADARAALEAATTAEEVVAVEPLVRRARSVLGIEVPHDRTVRIAERWVSWADVGASYAGVVAAARPAQIVPSPDQRHTGVRSAQWKDETRGHARGD